jgi:hypothetical protein
MDGGRTKKSPMSCLVFGKYKKGRIMEHEPRGNVLEGIFGGKDILHSEPR